MQLRKLRLGCTAATRRSTSSEHRLPARNALSIEQACSQIGSRSTATMCCRVRWSRQPVAVPTPTPRRRAAGRRWSWSGRRRRAAIAGTTSYGWGASDPFAAAVHPAALSGADTPTYRAPVVDQLEGCGDVPQCPAGTSGAFVARPLECQYLRSELALQGKPLSQRTATSVQWRRARRRA